MRPASFEYVRAQSLDEAIEELSRHGQDSCILAGGQILMNRMRRRLANPARVIDVSRLDELRYVRLEGQYLAVGALTRLADVAVHPIVVDSCPALAEAASAIGDVQVRNRGTVGGNIFPTTPDVSDIQPVLVASGGSLIVRNATGSREVVAEDFVAAGLEGSLAADDFVVELRFGGMGCDSAFEKLARRAADPSIVNSAAFVRKDEVGARVVGAAVGGAHSHVFRLHDLEAVTAGQPFDVEGARRLLAPLNAGLRPPATAHAGSDYRRDVWEVIALRAVERALRGEHSTEPTAFVRTHR